MNDLRAVYKNKYLSVSLILFALIAFAICLPLNLSAAELNEGARASRISDSGATAEAGLNSRISFQTDDFVFVVKSANGEYEAAGPDNIKDPVLLKGMSVAACNCSRHQTGRKNKLYARLSIRVQVRNPCSRFITNRI